ncbi:hypothetical protein TNCV_1488571 [Trichonephila clavipes]|nr:hypothetical protein TNCV_1488571 [Trichonephila clavipes]
MEYDRDFAINLSLYEGADLGDYISFMVLLRSHVNTMKPSEVMVLGLTEVLVEKIQQLFPNLDLRDISSLEPFANLQPADFFHNYLKKDASKGKGAFIQAVWTVIAKTKLYNSVNKALRLMSETQIEEGQIKINTCIEKKIYVVKKKLFFLQRIDKIVGSLQRFLNVEKHLFLACVSSNSQTLSALSVEIK